ncbi:hypothetical protein [Enterococcus faecium]|uniref:hypothetical protein n=1 Tax=Enterococcus faecium TaxID=1352 RepID=UPI00032EF350|nr:hypothetical protein [Enterococcus faecium]EOF77703.1 hypothetical protein SGC_01918 [Enterococcus faecium EnGen0136]
MDQNSDKLFLKFFPPTVISVLSYFICQWFSISEYIFRINNENWNSSISLTIYAGILNYLYSLLLSKRTEITVLIRDKGDRSDKIKVGEKPRRISVEVSVKGNLKNLSGNIEIVFPSWIDIMMKATPDIYEIEGTNRYKIDLSDIKSVIEENATYYFDINTKSIYLDSPRNGQISSEIKCGCFRYSKIEKYLNIFSDADKESSS